MSRLASPTRSVAERSETLRYYHIGGVYASEGLTVTFLHFRFFVPAR